LDFFQRNTIPFWQMSNHGNRVNVAYDWVLSTTDGTTQIVYRWKNSVSTSMINMVGFPGMYKVQWYNPRSGGALQNGSIASIISTGANVNISLGNPPVADGKDWITLIQRL
jgi:Putative collagen-binding domain of a collagenase